MSRTLVTENKTYYLLDIQEPPRLDLLEGGTISEHDFYWIVHPPAGLSKLVRRDLKLAGWHLQRHSRSNKEMWVFDKVDWGKTNDV